jgi:C4-dicarboxylate-specific signal transduction histidine kinase
MGELTASLAHEVNQPIAAAVTDANTGLRWLTREHPDMEEARKTALRVVKDATRASEIISRVRSLIKKGATQRKLINVNDSSGKWSSFCTMKQRGIPSRSEWIWRKIFPKSWEIECNCSRC